MTPNWVGSTWRGRQNLVSEMLCFELKTGRWIMSLNTIISYIYHRYELTDLIRFLHYRKGIVLVSALQKWDCVGFCITEMRLCWFLHYRKGTVLVSVLQKWDCVGFCITEKRPSLYYKSKYKLHKRKHFFGNSEILNKHSKMQRTWKLK
jgi:hypothetical protein